jgi:drug/metabolite transporter (DMT)-like permease
MKRLITRVGLLWAAVAVVAVLTAAAPDPDGDMPVWPFAVGAIAAVAAAAFWSVRRRP